MYDFESGSTNNEEVFANSQPIDFQRTELQNTRLLKRYMF